MEDDDHHSNDDHSDAYRSCEDSHIDFGKETPHCICTPSDDFRNDSVSTQIPRKVDKEEGGIAVDTDDHIEAACHMSDDTKESQKCKGYRTLIFRNCRK